MVYFIILILLALIIALYFSIRVANFYKEEYKNKKSEASELQEMIRNVVDADINYRTYAGHGMNQAEKYLLNNLLKETNDCSHKYLAKYISE